MREIDAALEAKYDAPRLSGAVTLRGAGSSSPLCILRGAHHNAPAMRKPIKKASPPQAARCAQSQAARKRIVHPIPAGMSLTQRLSQSINHIGQICGRPGNRTPCDVFGANYVGGPIAQQLMLALPVERD